MKIPRFFRKSLPVSVVLIAVAMVAWMFFGADRPGLLSMLVGILLDASIIFFVVTLIGVLVFRSIANALLLRFGESATAEVLAVAGTNESVNRVGVYRVRLLVQPSKGESFIGVAEDAIRMVNMMSAGDTVPVKYDPRTKEVALVLPKKVKWKSEDF